MTTGTPVWLDGPFHGNVARTDIDLEADSQPYNTLIFEECVTLFWQAVEHVKAVGGIGDWRGILFWFDSEEGALTRHFQSETTLASANIVLARSGDRFLAAGQLRLPEDIDGHRFESLFGHVPNLECFGFHLPDPWLLREGRGIVDKLAGQPCRTAPVSTFVDRTENGKSLIEMACRLRRDDGPEWWEPFLNWLTEQIQTARLPMEALGVHAQSRILVHHPRQGYFKSWSYSHLSMEGKPSCPFRPAASFWGDYLDHLLRRPAQTCSGQVFFARPLSWIDGLEDPDAREAVMEMVLKRPAKYEEYVKTNVQRQDGSDRHSFPSLWMWAIQTKRWAVVPSNDGPKSIDAVWILHSDQRRRRFVDEKLLVWLPEKFNRSHTLVTALGVHSPDNAPVERVALELHRAAERLPAGDWSEEPATRMLVQTLYEWLHERCENHKARNVPPNLACLLERPVPLMKGQRVESVDLKGGSCLYLNDDPQRSPHVAGFASGYALPLSAKSGFRALFDCLQQLLGAERVRRVSQEPIDPDFSENLEMPGGRLLDLIEQSFGASPGDMELELAALIAYGRSEQPMDPAKQAFRRSLPGIAAWRWQSGRRRGSGLASNGCDSAKL